MSNKKEKKQSLEESFFEKFGIMILFIMITITAIILLGQISYNFKNFMKTITGTTVNDPNTFLNKEEKVCSNLAKINIYNMTHFHPHIVWKMKDIYNSTNHEWFITYVDTNNSEYVQTFANGWIIECKVPITLCDTGDVMNQKYYKDVLHCTEDYLLVRTTYEEWKEWYEDLTGE